MAGQNVCKSLLNVYCIHSTVNNASVALTETEMSRTNLLTISDIYQRRSSFHLFTTKPPLAVYVIKLAATDEL